MRPCRVLGEAVSIKGIDNLEDMKSIFRRLKDFAENCQLQVLRRFDAKEVWKHGRIFNLGYQHTAPVVQTAVHDIVEYLKIDIRPCLDQMRSAFAIRDVLLKQEKFEQAEELWAKVLADLKAQQLLCRAFGRKFCFGSQPGSSMRAKLFRDIPGV